MNEFGEPNMGNPSVRFDEGRERVVIGVCLSLQLSRLLYVTKLRKLRPLLENARFAF